MSLFCMSFLFFCVFRTTHLPQKAQTNSEYVIAITWAMWHYLRFCLVLHIFCKETSCKKYLCRVIGMNLYWASGRLKPDASVQVGVGFGTSAATFVSHGFLMMQSVLFNFTNYSITYLYDLICYDLQKKSTLLFKHIRKRHDHFQYDF